MKIEHYYLNLNSEQQIKVPQSSTFVGVGLDDGVLELFVLTPSVAEGHVLQTVTVRICEQGEDVSPEKTHYVGRVLQKGEWGRVWRHVFVEL